MKKRFYKIIIFIACLFFLVELIPTLSMNSYIDELSYRLDENVIHDQILREKARTISIISFSVLEVSLVGAGLGLLYIVKVKREVILKWLKSIW